MADDTLPRLTKADLVAALARGAKPKAAWRIGSEHEKFVFFREDNRPVPYEGRRGIGAILAAMQGFDWEPKYEAGNLVALRQNGASITLEPGGQLELSGAPLENLHETCREVNGHLAQVKAIGERFDVGFLGMGFHPTARLDEIPVMPKARYRIMRAYMPKRGRLGLDMMFRTCTVQVNLDFSDEADMRKKFRVGLALQPVATALFANSPFTEGRPNGFLSYRSHVWTDTDPDRTGLLDFVFEDGFGFERYVDYMLDVPMYFVERDGVMHDVAGQSFRDFLAGRLPGLPGAWPTMKDWEDHLTTAFPEVRLKTFLEMRGADGGPWARLCALPAFWVGLLYDASALDAAWDLVRNWTIAEMQELRQAVARTALETRFRDRKVRDIARDCLAIAEAGLRGRDRRNAAGETESVFLAPLHEMAGGGPTLAEEMLAAWHGRWRGDVSRVFEDYLY
ncbi:MAG: glutamate--cysteine ligase [Alphaproteobacteria bacterium]|nr:MAG: glutamate--cysteine ligase [Alphaproteobacteria bacterium]